MKKQIFLASLLFCSMFTWAVKPTLLTSPNGEISMSVCVLDKISYTVSYGKDLLLDNCSLSLELENETLGLNPKLKKSTRSVINETFKKEIPFKNSMVQNQCNVLKLDFSGNYSIEFRAYDDGVAYRFITNKGKEIIVKNEVFNVNFSGDCKAVLQQPSSFKTAYENKYEQVSVKEFQTSGKMANLPAAIESKSPYKILITETDLFDYPCMFLKGNGANGMTSLFPKVPTEFGDDGDRSVKILKEADYIAKTKGTRSFPWRLMIITNDDRKIVESDLVTKLSSRNRLGDVSWVKPGQVSWEWWHDAALYGVDFESGYNLNSYKYYIDFAATFGMSYIIMDEGWAMSTRDPYTPNPNVDVHELIRYGKTKNVKIILWLTWLTVEKNLDTLFKTFSEWGVAGVKIDFMDRSDQWMVNYYERVAKEAAKYHVMVDFHGAFKPAGLQDACPNVISYEGVLGLEQGGNCKPDNSVYLPFMRNVCGPMDFTPGAMLNAQPENLGYSRIKPVGTGTRAFQMSTFICFESGLQMLADNPFNYYRERECTEFITKVPVTWDETKALVAEAGKVLIIAKRKGDKWYVGGMCNSSEKVRLIDVPLNFLSAEKTYKVTAFEDGINAGRQGADYKKCQFDSKKGDALKVRMVRNGGYAAVFE
jgi:alpha-glucosidase